MRQEQCRKEAADEAKVKVEDDPSCVVAIAGSVEVQSEDVAEVAAEVADAGTVDEHFCGLTSSVPLVAPFLASL